MLTSLKTAKHGQGADCFCPLECEDVAYLPELSQARIREKGDAVDVRH